MKNFLSILLLALLPFFKCLAEVVIDDYRYELYPDTKTATVIGHSKGRYVNIVIIPETVQYEEEEYTVTEIGENAFYGAEAVTLPKTIKRIRKNAFMGAEIETLRISDLTAWCNVEIEEGNELFFRSKYSDYVYVYLNGKKMKELVIPEGVTAIGDHVFRGWYVETVTVPASLKSVGYLALNLSCMPFVDIYITDLEAWLKIHFSQNPVFRLSRLYLNGQELTELTIPESITAINDYAFYNCRSLQSVSITKNVQTIGSNAFYGCANVSRFNCYAAQVPETADDAFGSQNDPPLLSSSLYVPEEAVESYRTHAPWNMFMSLVPIGGEPEGVEFVEEGIRYLCSNPMSTAVKLIGGDVSSADGKLDISTVVHDGITYQVVEVGAGALMNCEALTALSFGNSVKIIGPQAFRGCQNLEDVECLPQNLELLGDSAFMDCCNMKLKSLPSWVVGENIKYFPQTLKQQESPYSCAGAFSDCMKMGSALYSFDHYQLPESWTEIPERMFCGISSISGSLYITSNIKRLGKEAFCGDGFQTLTLSEGLESIEEKALYGILTTTIKLPSTIRELGYLAIGHDPDDVFYNGPLNKITCLAAEPPVNDSRGAFNADVYETAELIVPDESLELYMSAPDWRRFKNIRGINGRTGIHGVRSHTVATPVIYDRQGRKIQNATKGIYIRDGRKVVVK